MVLIIREQDPLKQGLKLYSKIRTNKKENIREQDPLKKGQKLLNLPLFRYAAIENTKVYMVSVLKCPLAICRWTTLVNRNKNRLISNIIKLKQKTTSLILFF